MVSMVVIGLQDKVAVYLTTNPDTLEVGISQICLNCDALLTYHSLEELNSLVHAEEDTTIAKNHSEVCNGKGV